MTPGPRLRWRITGNLALLREQVVVFGQACGLRGETLQNLLIAVNEAASNALEHGGLTRMVHLLKDDSGIQVEVIDSGGRLKTRHLERKLELRPNRGMGLGIIQRIGHDVTVDHPGGHSRLRFRVSSGTRPASRAARGGVSYGPFGRSLDLMARTERLRAQARRLTGYTPKHSTALDQDTEPSP
ncbi:hypothetical protein GCM10009850_065800 [Nonomuraea monospora]|uniref:Histidine kinase/HSP90-like ATPase domain-containing protein n=1 Tax=Nonomuraea monospora TaxID=568818 RepID=A0ABN3CNV8_9ACTN